MLPERQGYRVNGTASEDVASELRTATETVEEGGTRRSAFFDTIEVPGAPSPGFDR